MRIYLLLCLTSCRCGCDQEIAYNILCLSAFFTYCSPYVNVKMKSTNFEQSVWISLLSLCLLFHKFEAIIVWLARQRNYFYAFVFIVSDFSTWNKECHKIMGHYECLSDLIGSQPAVFVPSASKSAGIQIPDTKTCISK